MVTSHRDTGWVLQRTQQLIQENQDDRSARVRIRQIMNGGADGVEAVLAWNLGKEASSHGDGRLSDMIGVDLPTVNLVASGLDRLGQKIGRMPTLKPPKGNYQDSQERMDIIETWDEWQELELDLPQIGRWIPGYGFGMWVINQRRNDKGELYPVMELRNPFDVYPGWAGPRQQPTDACIVRMVPLHALEAVYSEAIDWEAAKTKLEANRTGARTKAILDAHGGIPDLSKLRAPTGDVRTWEGRQTGIEVIEYYCHDGTHVVVPELEVRLNYIETPIEGGTFDIPKRISFDRLQSQYHHIIGLQGMMAKMNILGLVASEDSVFAPTNIFGTMLSQEYELGRFGFNEFENTARVEKGQIQQVNHIWAQIDRLERQLRIGATYDVQQDAISPNSFATGQGMRELQGALTDNVNEYLNAIRRSLMRCDSKRLQFAEAVYDKRKRTYYDMEGKPSTYVPKTAIAGDWRTRRIYGAMATFDTAQKIVVGLQLLDKIIDVETFQENIDGLTDLPLIQRRLTIAKYREAALARLMAKTAEDPRADAVIAQIMANPDDEIDLLTAYFAPEDEQEMAQLPMAMPPGAQAGLPPEAISTVLSRVEQGGGVEGGAQTVAR